MERINEHIDEAHYHLVAAAMLLEQEFSRSYCRDVTNGRIVGLLDLHAQLQEVKRLAAAVGVLTPTAPVGADAQANGPVLAGGSRPSAYLDQAA
jgi:hypothetical protein